MSLLFRRVGVAMSAHYNRFYPRIGDNSKKIHRGPRRDFLGRSQYPFGHAGRILVCLKEIKEKGPILYSNLARHSDREQDSINPKAQVYEVDQLSIRKNGSFDATSKTSQPVCRYETSVNGLKVIFINGFRPSFLKASNTELMETIARSTRVKAQKELILSSALRFSIYPKKNSIGFCTFDFEHQDMFQNLKEIYGFENKDFITSCRGYVKDGQFELGCSYSGDLDRVEKRINTNLKEGNEAHKEILHKLGVMDCIDFEARRRV